MKVLLQQRFFRLLSEYSQRKVSASEFAEAIEQLAIHLVDFSFNEQDYSVLLRYFPSPFSRQNKPYQYHGNSQRLVSFQSCNISEWETYSPDGLRQSL
ncbi:hypothetical protein [Phocaeicola sp.]